MQSLQRSLWSGLCENVFFPHVFTVLTRSLINVILDVKAQEALSFFYSPTSKLSTVSNL